MYNFGQTPLDTLLRNLLRQEHTTLYY